MGSDEKWRRIQVNMAGAGHDVRSWREVSGHVRVLTGEGW